MTVKIVAGLIALTLFVLFVLPVVIKLKEGALTVVIAIGIAMMAFDLWQSIRKSEP